MHFPEISCNNLAGETFNLPGDFEGAFNLCLIAFQRWHQSLVNSWVPLAEHLEETYPQLVYYELPVIRRLNPLFRSFIDQGMRGGIPEATARHKTITLYMDKTALKEALEIDDEETIHLRLVDPSGRVHWAGSGPVTKEAADALEATVKALAARDRT